MINWVKTKICCHSLSIQFNIKAISYKVSDNGSPYWHDSWTSFYKNGIGCFSSEEIDRLLSLSNWVFAVLSWGATPLVLIMNSGHGCLASFLPSFSVLRPIEKRFTRKNKQQKHFISLKKRRKNSLRDRNMLVF